MSLGHRAYQCQSVKGFHERGRKFLPKTHDTICMIGAQKRDEPMANIHRNGFGPYLAIMIPTLWLADGSVYRVIEQDVKYRKIASTTCPCFFSYRTMLDPGIAASSCPIRNQPLTSISTPGYPTLRIKSLLA